MQCVSKKGWLMVELLQSITWRLFQSINWSGIDHWKKMLTFECEKT